MTYSFLKLGEKFSSRDIVYAVIFILLFISLSLISGCGSKDTPIPEPTEAERVTTLLTKAKWNPSSSTGWVTVDGVDASELFTGFTITFTATGYTTTGTSPIWQPATDTWHFTSGSTTEIIRDSDGLSITIETIDEATLKLSLYWDHDVPDGGRKHAIKGNHTFNLAK